jgi:hypothetical protein
MTTINVSSQPNAASSINHQAWHIPLTCLVVSPLGSCLTSVDDCSCTSTRVSKENKAHQHNKNPALLQLIAEQQLEPLTRLLVTLQSLPLNQSSIDTKSESASFRFTTSESTLFKHQIVMSSGEFCSVCLIQPTINLLKQTLPSDVDLKSLSLQTSNQASIAAHNLNTNLHEKQSNRLKSINKQHSANMQYRIANDSIKVQIQAEMSQTANQHQTADEIALQSFVESYYASNTPSNR